MYPFKIDFDDSDDDQTYTADGRLYDDRECPMFDIVREVPSEPGPACESHSFGLGGKCGNCGIHCDDYVKEERRKAGLEPAEQPKPWDCPADVPMPCVVRWIGGMTPGKLIDSGKHLVTTANTFGIRFSGGPHNWDVCQYIEYTTDGRTWKPCVKEGA